ncbi:MAG TPA: cysteine desulfurase [Candidatus Nanoarchaeia archaeon]|nr:cysteine desulfurase [Candidatus Nanoarchaeia archaeon]
MENIRKDFPILKRKIYGKKLVYLDNASTTQKPQAVLDAVNDYYRLHNANIHRGIYKISEEATEMYEKAHENASNFINAGFKEVVFTRNTTESINLAAYSLCIPDLKRGEEIVLTRMEHHSNLVPWQQIAKMKGAKLKFIEMHKDGSLDMESAKKAITNKTKIVSAVHMSNVLGTVNDVRELGRIAHSRNALMLVDGAQSVPHMPVDAKKLDFDFLAFSAHKMLGPTGIGCLYGKEEILQKMRPFIYGGEMIREVSYTDTKFNDLPWKFEAGTSNIAGAVGFGAAIDYLSRIGMENVEEYGQTLLKVATKALSQIQGLKIIGNSGKKGSIVSFDTKGIPPHDMATILDTEGICIRAGHHCAMPLMRHLGLNGTSRASFYIYNTKEDIAKLAEGIEKARKIFGA